jgi:hypothetical protein
MPKKTKRQKILARQRRHIQLTPSSVTPTVSATFRFQESHAPVKPIETVDDREELDVIRKDLTKTLILAVIAVVIELGVHSMLHGT